jgi:hypothetical protein
MKQTFEDVRNFILTEDCHAASYKRKLVGRLSSYARKSNRTLAAIPADLDLFEKEFGKGRSELIPTGYKTKRQANTAASEIRSALKAYLASRLVNDDETQQAENDDWDTVLASLVSIGVQKQPLIGVRALIKACRDAGRQPHAVTHNFLMDIIRRSVTAGAYQAIQNGWALIELHADEISKRVVLPQEMPLPSLAKTRNVCQRLPLPPKLHRQWLTWIELKRSPRHVGVVDRSQQPGVKERTLKSYFEGLTYYYTCLITMGYLGAGDDPDLFDIIDLGIVEEIIFTELSGGFPWDNLGATTLHGNVTRLLSIATELGLNCDDIRKKVADYKDFKNVRKMSPRRRVWCQQLMADHSRVVAFYTLPAATFKTASALMSDYDSLSLNERQRAIKASIAACAFAIMLSLPFRIGTMIQLKHSGSQADVFAFQDKSDLIVNTTAEMVKNGYTHERVYLTPKAGGNPKQIVKWFIEKVHPLLVEDHIDKGLRNPELLFAGIGEHRLRKAIVDHAVDHGIDLTPHLLRHGIATLLANEARADYPLIAALLGDTVDTVIRNYAFVDQAKLHVAGQDKLAASQQNALRRRTKT